MRLCRYFCNRWYFLLVFKEQQPGIGTSVLNMYESEVALIIMIRMMKYRCCQRFSCSLFPCSYFVSAKVTTGMMNNLFLMDSAHHHFGPTWPTQDSNPGSSYRKATNHCANVEIQKYAFKNISTPLFFGWHQFPIVDSRTNKLPSLTLPLAEESDWSVLNVARRCSSAPSNTERDDIPSFTGITDAIGTIFSSYVS